MYEEVLLLCGTLSHGEEVTVTRVGDGHDTSRSKSASRLGSVQKKMDVPNTEELSSGSTKSHVSSSKVVNRGLRQHGVVLKLGLAQRRAVAGDQDKLSYKSEDTMSVKGPSQPHAPVPGERVGERYGPLPLRICLRADL